MTRGGDMEDCTCAVAAGALPNEDLVVLVAEYGGDTHTAL